MDPITTAIVAALGKLAEPAVRDAYEGLKALIVRKLKPEQQSVVQTIEHLQGKPSAATRRADLEQEIRESPLAADEDVLVAARELLKLTGPAAQVATQHVVQTITGNGNVAAGIGSVVITEASRRR